MPPRWLLEYLQAALNQPYEALLRRHVEDHQRLFRRVTLDLGSSAYCGAPDGRTPASMPH